MHPDREIKVSYFRVLPGTPLAQQAAAYWERTERFVKSAKQARNAVGAHSLLVVDGLSDYQIYGATFNKDARPTKGWKRMLTGDYMPTGNSAIKAFNVQSLPVFSSAANVPLNSRLGKLDQTFVIACPHGRKGPYTTELEGALPMSTGEVAALKRTVPVAQAQAFVLDRAEHMPALIKSSCTFAALPSGTVKASKPKATALNWFSNALRSLT